jgi:PAS domain S-box-containing protein
MQSQTAYPILNALAHPAAVLDSNGEVIGTNLAWREREASRSSATPTEGAAEDRPFLRRLGTLLNCGDKLPSMVATGFEQVLSAEVETFCCDVDPAEHGSLEWIRCRGNRFVERDGKWAILVVVEEATLPGSQSPEGDGSRASSSLVSKEHFMKVFHSSSHAALLLDANGFLDCNHPAVRLLRYENREQILRLKPWDISPPRQPDGSSSRERSEEIEAEAYRQGSTRFDWVLKAADGSRVPVEVTLTSVRIDGVSVLHAELKDCAELQEVESALASKQALLRSLLDSIPDLIFYKDLDGVYFGCNEAFAELVGQPKGEIVGKTDLDLFDLEVGAFFQRMDREMLESGRAKQNEEWVTYPDGSRVLLDTLKTPYFGAGGECLGLIGISRNITDRYFAQRARDHSERILSGTFNSLQDLIVVVDRELRVVMTNGRNGAAALPNPEVGRLYCVGCVNRRAEPCDDCYVRKVFKTGKQEKREVEDPQNGRWFILQLSPIRDEKGDVCQVVKLVRDVSKRRKMEEALRASEEQYRMIYDSSRDAILQATTEGELVGANQTAIAMFRCRDEAQLLSCGLSGVSAVYQEDGTKSSEKVKAMLAETVEKGPHQFEWVHRRLDGTEFLASVHLTPMTVAGRQLVHGTLRDVTHQKRAAEALRESEEKFRSIASSAQDAIVMMDSYGNISFWNNAAEKIFGYPRHQAIGRPVHQLLSMPSARQGFQGAFPEFQRSGHGRLIGRTVETDAVRADGAVFPIEISLSAVRLKNEWHALAIIRDISARKQAEGELREHRERLAELVEERSQKLIEAERQMLQAEKLASVGRLAAGVAHEINTPVQYIGDNLTALEDFVGDLARMIELYRGLVADLPRDPGVEEKRAAIAEAEAAADLEFILADAPQAIAQGKEGVQRVSQIVRAMKDFSHADRGQANSIDLNHALASTLTVARNEYKYHAEIETFFAALPPVECFASELNQVFLNLVINAAHAIAATGQPGKITVRTHWTDEDHVEVTITDTGTGIPEEIRTQIFDPFFTTKEVGQGTGQGLSIAHQIVVGKHRGKLWFETEMGKGTTFHVRIPISMPNDSAVAKRVNDEQEADPVCG